MIEAGVSLRHGNVLDIPSNEHNLVCVFAAKVFPQDLNVYDSILFQLEETGLHG